MQKESSLVCCDQWKGDWKEFVQQGHFGVVVSGRKVGRDKSGGGVHLSTEVSLGVGGGREGA